MNSIIVLIFIKNIGLLLMLDVLFAFIMQTYSYIAGESISIIIIIIIIAGMTLYIISKTLLEIKKTRKEG